MVCVDWATQRTTGNAAAAGHLTELVACGAFREAPQSNSTVVEDASTLEATPSPNSVRTRKF